MTGAVIGMGIIGVVIIIASFLVVDRYLGQNDRVDVDLVKVNESYEFSDQERDILKHKIEDVISEQAKNILYETNQSLESMSSEKIMMFGNYASVALQEIEKKQEELTAQYNLLDIKYKEIIKSAKLLEEVQRGAKRIQVSSDDSQEKTDAEKGREQDNRSEKTEEKQTGYKTEKKKKNQVNKNEKDDRKEVSGKSKVEEKKDDVKKTGEEEKREDDKSKEKPSVSGMNKEKEVSNEKIVPKENESAGKEIKTAAREKTVQKEEKATDQAEDGINRKEDVAEAETEDQKTDGETRKTDGKDQQKSNKQKKADAKPKNETDTSEKQDDVNDRIKEMYKGGSSIADIAKQLGLSVGEVKRTVNTLHRRKK